MNENHEQNTEVPKEGQNGLKPNEQNHEAKVQSESKVIQQNRISDLSLEKNQEENNNKNNNETFQNNEAIYGNRVYITFQNFDQKRPNISSPRALRAIELSGIQMETLAKKSRDEIKKIFASKGFFDQESIKQFQIHLQEKRQKKLEKLKKFRNDIIMLGEMEAQQKQRAQQLSNISFSSTFYQPNTANNGSISERNNVSKLNMFEEEKKQLERIKKQQTLEIQAMVESELELKKIMHDNFQKEKKLQEIIDQRRTEAYMKQRSVQEKRLQKLQEIRKKKQQEQLKLIKQIQEQQLKQAERIERERRKKQQERLLNNQREAEKQSQHDQALMATQRQEEQTYEQLRAQMAKDAQQEQKLREEQEKIANDKQQQNEELWGKVEMKKKQVENKNYSGFIMKKQQFDRKLMKSQLKQREIIHQQQELKNRLRSRFEQKIFQIEMKKNEQEKEKQDQESKYWKNMEKKFSLLDQLEQKKMKEIETRRLEQLEKEKQVLRLKQEKDQQFTQKKNYVFLKQLEIERKIETRETERRNFIQKKVEESQKTQKEKQFKHDIIELQSEREKQQSFRSRQIKSHQALRQISQERLKNQFDKLTSNMIKRMDIEEKIMENHQKDEIKKIKYMERLHHTEERLMSFEKEKMNLALERLEFSNRVQAEKLQIKKQIERRFRSQKQMDIKALIEEFDLKIEIPPHLRAYIEEDEQKNKKQNKPSFGEKDQNNEENMIKHGDHYHPVGTNLNECTEHEGDQKNNEDISNNQVPQTQQNPN